MIIDHTCWSCGNRHDGMTAIGNDAPGPEPGDMMFCFSCGEWGAFDPFWKGSIRKPTFEEFAEIVASRKCRMIREAWLVVVKKKSEERNESDAL